jgi:DnaJ like chaperone protein
VYKFIFAVVGYFAFGLFGAFIGYLIGSSLDRARDFGVGGMNPLSAGQRQTVFLETVFILMGKLAKADGHISKDEINHVENFIKQVGLTPEHRQDAIRQFKRGAEADYDINEALTHFMKVCGHTANLRHVLLMYLIVIALADGTLDPAERALLASIAQHIGFSQTEFDHMLDMVLNQSHFRSGQSPTNQTTALADAYKALGVSETLSDQEIKRAYRKLMSQYHPDKLIGQGLPEDMIEVATEQAKEIQVAYDLIKKHREKKA